MVWFDSHCHFDFPVFDSDREAIWQWCQQAGVAGLLIPGVSRSQCQQLATVCQGQPWWYALGLHPFFTHQPADLDWLSAQIPAATTACVAVGETGLDWRRARTQEQRQQQFELLDRHIELARDHDLPLILHAVGAHDELLMRLRRARFDCGGVIHAFSGSLQQAQRYVDSGFHLGAGGLISRPNARRVLEAIRYLPASAWLLETDAPDMTPAFWAESRNSPVCLPLLGQILARYWKKSLSETQVVLLDNLRQTFPKGAPLLDFQPSKV